MTNKRTFPLRFIADSSFIIDLFKDTDIAIDAKVFAKISFNPHYNMVL